MRPDSFCDQVSSFVCFRGRRDDYFVRDWGATPAAAAAANGARARTTSVTPPTAASGALA